MFLRQLYYRIIFLFFDSSSWSIKEEVSRKPRARRDLLGPRLKIIISNILHESQRNELKYSLKIAFMFLSIIVKWQVANLSILLVIRKKVSVLDSPCSSTQ